MRGSEDEFPLLAAHGLYAAETAGNGNCLFNALSDQLFGTQSRHYEIRLRVIEYLREHQATYKCFIDVNPGGGVRRNPKRKNAGAFSSPVNMAAPTEEEINRSFENHLSQMAKGGTYGDNMEIVGFCEAYRTNVKIYQRDFAYMANGKSQDEERPVAHIAYHTWEHYSSVRNLAGPHTGLPIVTPTFVSSEVEKAVKAKASTTSHVAPWMVKAVLESLPYIADQATVSKVLEESKGHVDNAVSKLLDAEERGSISSTPGSSSVERDGDDDDEGMSKPAKKQDRRMSRATRQFMKDKLERRAHELVHRPKASESCTTAKSSTTSTEEPSLAAKYEDIGESEDECWIPSNGRGSISASSSASDVFKMSKPRATDAIHLELSSPSTLEDATTELAKSTPVIRSSQASPNDESAKQVKAKRLTARDKKEQKKAAQKAARKERSLADASDKAYSGKITLTLAPKRDKENNPAFESVIKTLYI